MKKINWKIRFSKNNMLFIVRFIIALLIPILTYFDMETKDLTSWAIVGELLTKFIQNPYLIGLMIINALNLIPDPTTNGVYDSERALTYNSVKDGK